MKNQLLCMGALTLVGLAGMTLGAQTRHRGSAKTLPPLEDEFVPKDVYKAVAVGCVVAGDKGPPPFVETQVFVKNTDDDKGWDFHPKMSRRDYAQGGVLKAIDDCTEWLTQVRKQMEKHLEKPFPQQADPIRHKDLGVPVRASVPTLPKTFPKHQNHLQGAVK
jgi:hypothetical protein